MGGDDWSLLEAFARGGDEAAFAELVRRHLGLVYSAALRQLGDPSAAEEVAGSVFVLLSRKARSLRPGGSLASWLYRSACLVAKKRRASDTARRRREQRAYEMEMVERNPDGREDSEAPTGEWAALAPVIDDAMGSLREADRTAVLLRYFQNRPLREVGAALGVSEDAARKRLARALGRMRTWLARRGVDVSVVALAGVLANRAVVSVPEHVAQATVQTVITNAAASSPATASTLLTSMSTTKLALATAVVAGGLIPISIELMDGRAGSAAPAIAAPENASPRAPEVPPAAAAAGLIAEWRRLVAEHGPDTGSLAKVYDAIREIGDDFKRRAFRGALIQQWLATDPGAALGYVREHDPDRTGYLLARWLELAPEAAVAAMVEHAGDLGRAIDPLLDEVARAAPDSLAALAQMVEKRSSWTHHVRDAFAVVAEGDHDLALAVAAGLSGDQRGEALAGVALGWAATDPEAALAWAQESGSVAGLGPEARGWVMRSLLVGWGKRDPAGALDHLDLAPPGGAEMEFANDTGGQVLRAATEADFEGVLDWIGRNPGQLGDESLGALSGELGKRLAGDPHTTLDLIRDHPASTDLLPALNSLLLNDGYDQKDAVWGWLGRQPAGPHADEVRRRLLQAAAWKEPDVALAWMAELGDGIDPETRSQLVRSMVNEHNEPEAFANMLDRVPKGLRDELLAAGFDHIDPGRSGGIGTWLDRLDELGPERLPSASRSLARRWADSDPGAAVAWSLTLPPGGEQRSAALDAAVSAWAASDSYELSEWIAGMPGGADRDIATSAMVQSIAASEPDSAWEWATTITEPGLRLRGLSRAYGGMMESDPAGATLLLQDTSLTDGELAALAGQAAPREGGEQ